MLRAGRQAPGGAEMPFAEVAAKRCCAARPATHAPAPTADASVMRERVCAPRGAQARCLRRAGATLVAFAAPAAVAARRARRRSSAAVLRVAVTPGARGGMPAAGALCRTSGCSSILAEAKVANRVREVKIRRRATRRRQTASATLPLPSHAARSALRGEPAARTARAKDTAPCRARRQRHEGIKPCRCAMPGEDANGERPVISARRRFARCRAHAAARSAQACSRNAAVLAPYGMRAACVACASAVLPPPVPAARRCQRACA